MRRIRSAALLVWIVALSGAGAWMSGTMLKRHANLWGAHGANSGLLGRLCDAAQLADFDCNGASKGRWSQVTVPLPVPSRNFTIHTRLVVIPTAFLGLAYFVCLGVWFAFAGRPRLYGAAWYWVPLAISLCGAAVSAFLLFSMALGWAPRCVVCVAVHLVNFLMVYGIWRLRPLLEPSNATPALVSHHALSVAAFALILVGGLWLYRREHITFGEQIHKLLYYKALVVELQSDPDFLLREYYAQTQHDIPLRPGEAVPPDHAQLVVFTDFECSSCYCHSRALRESTPAAFGGRLSVLLRHYPLCTTCNDGARHDVHPNACAAAYAAEAARLQGGDETFWTMHDLLFKNRSRLGEDLYRELALQIGLDADRLLLDMEGALVRQSVASDIELAKRLDVGATPTMFLNGRRVTQLCQGPGFWTAAAKAWASPSYEARVGGNPIHGQSMAGNLGRGCLE
jgi:hypothetical protein